MSKLTSARSGVPSAKPWAPPMGFNSGRRQKAYLNKAKVLSPACVVFLSEGPNAVAQFLGSRERLFALLPDMERRIEFWKRAAKRRMQ